LGLAISNALIRQMDGRISVESHLKKGSVFRVDIPMKTSDSPLTGDQRQGRGKIMGLVLGQESFRIMVAEDKVLASQLTLSEEQERRRIATDLHDHIGQSLSIHFATYPFVQ